MAQFVWRANRDNGDSYYKAWDDKSALLGTSKTWERANLVYNYGSIAIWGIAFLTQILSFGGILVDINLLTWTLGVVLGGTFVTLIYELLQFYSIYMAYSKDQESSANGTGSFVL